MIDWDNVTAEVQIEIDAPAQVVWGLISDLSRTPEWNRETVATEWVPPHDHVAVGAVFRGTNRGYGREWSLECHVTVADAPNAFEWTVLDPAQPSSSWWYRLDAVGDRTVVRHGFQHGPGPSFLRVAVDRDPDNASAIAAGRTATLADNMRHTLACIKVIAESPTP